MSALAHQVRLFLTALQFLTRVPVPAWVGHAPDQLNQSARYFPLVGLVVGAVGAGVFVAVDWAAPQAVAAIFAIAATVFLTGAFHEDGLADTADGVGGGQTREDALEIMRDSRIGTYGTAALVGSLALRGAILATLPASVVPAALLAAHGAGRGAVLCVIRLGVYARTTGTAKPLAQRLTTAEMLFGVWIALAGALPAGAAGVIAVFAAIWAGLFVYALLSIKLGGYTGDGLGAIEQIAEITALLMIGLVRWN